MRWHSFANRIIGILRLADKVNMDTQMPSNFSECEDWIIEMRAELEKLEKEQVQDLEVWAAAEHECWSNWMKYMFSKGDKELQASARGYGYKGDYTLTPTGRWCMPIELEDRWKRQMITPYAELTEKEKQSDRDVVMKYHGEHVHFK